MLAIGEMTIAAGALEGAVIGIASRMLNRSLKAKPNSRICDLLIKALETWPGENRESLTDSVKGVLDVYKKRNSLIHASFAIAADNSIHNVPAGSIIDIRSFGWGFASARGDIRLLAKRISLDDIEKLTEELHSTRLALVPLMEVADSMPNETRITRPEAGKLLRDYRA